MAHTNYCGKLDCDYRGVAGDDYQCSAKDCKSRQKPQPHLKQKISTVDIMTIAPSIWDRVKFRTLDDFMKVRKG